MAGSDDKQAPGLDRQLIIKDAAKRLDSVSRRLFVRKSLSLGALVMLTGCKLTDGNTVEKMLMAMSRLNDKAQGWLFDPKHLAPEYTEAMITRPFPFNAYYGVDDVRPAPDGYKLQVGGLVSDKRPLTLEALRAMPQTEQITRHICVEGWSAIGRWGGVRFSDFLKHIGADTQARYVGFKCFDDYYTSIDMATALHPQTLLSLTYDGKTLPAEYGYPMKLRMPTKLGFKNPKYIAEIYVTNDNPGGYWEDKGYNWFSGS